MWGKRTKEEERFILSIDGGGMRGVIPSYILSEIDKMLKERGDIRPLISHFDLACGTSTGGLIALAMAAPEQESILKFDDEVQIHRSAQHFWQKDQHYRYPPAVSAQTIADLYPVHGKTIFPDSPSSLFGQIFSTKYSEQPVEKLLVDAFGDTKLNQSIIPVMVVSYDTNNGGKPFPMSSREHWSFLEAGRATSAAPVYFPPANLEDSTLLDGGVVANNPVLFAYKEARKLYPDCKKFHILSLATGGSELEVKISGSGVYSWIDPKQGAPIQKIYVAAQMQTADEIIQTIPGVDYTRITGKLTTRYRMDSTDPAVLEMMQLDAIRFIEENKTELSRFIDLMVARKPEHKENTLCTLNR